MIYGDSFPYALFNELTIKKLIQQLLKLKVQLKWITIIDATYFFLTSLNNADYFLIIVENAPQNTEEFSLVYFPCFLKIFDFFLFI